MLCYPKITDSVIKRGGLSLDKFVSLKEEKQVTIINAALSCFGKYGYAKASANDIAVLAGISKASVFQYFGSKKQLYAYLLTYAGDVL